MNYEIWWNLCVVRPYALMSLALLREDLEEGNIKSTRENLAILREYQRVYLQGKALAREGKTDE